MGHPARYAGLCSAPARGGGFAHLASFYFFAALAGINCLCAGWPNLFAEGPVGTANARLPKNSRRAATNAFTETVAARPPRQYHSAGHAGDALGRLRAMAGQWRRVVDRLCGVARPLDGGYRGGAQPCPFVVLHL